MARLLQLSIAALAIWFLFVGCAAEPASCDGDSCRPAALHETQAAAPLVEGQAAESDGVTPRVCEESELPASQVCDDPLPPAPPSFDDEPQPRPLEDLPLPSWPQAAGFEAPSGIECPHELLAGDVPAVIRECFHNRTVPGSCVQCSIGMCGVAQNVENATLLLWPSDFGPAQLHGSWPERVAKYSKERGLRIWNVTGAQNTYAWMKWACRNGRPVAISCNTAHFQTLLGHDPATGRWYVCNNNSPSQIDVYEDREFRARHESGDPRNAWCVILDYPPGAPRPERSAWWS